MKRKLFLMACCIAMYAGVSMAQDVIVTKNAEKINAKVLEVNTDDVRYKRFDNPEGPIYTLLKSKIASIMYQNGTVETFEAEKTPPQKALTPVQKPENTPVQKTPSFEAANRESGGKAAVVVAPAEVNDVVGVGHFGGYVSDMLMEQLLLGNKVRLLDRSVLNAQLDEVQLAGEYIDPNTAIQKGKIAGARYIIQVTMQKPDVVNVRTGIPLASIMGAAQAATGKNIGAQYASNAQVGTLKAAVTISTRVVDLETGEVVFMCSGSGKSQGKSQLSLEYGALGGAELNGGADGFKQTVTGKAIQQAFMSIGRNLNGYFAGDIDKKVIGSAGGALRYGDEISLRGASLYMGVEKMNKESAQMAFADHPEWFFQYKQAKSNINGAWWLMGVGAVASFFGIEGFIIGIYDGAGYVTALGSAGIAVGLASIGGGIYLNKKGHKQLRNIASEYNNSQRQSYYNNQPRLNLVMTGNGAGLRLTF
ncbi:MAG: CsgG/HfaB family protein [Tannerella sp.]|jgi:curli biogenesis system outer membrane secretion channel CsgG|nr:CsgG/HfaB family protein [Tannerella sp.]